MTKHFLDKIFIKSIIVSSIGSDRTLIEWDGVRIILDNRGKGAIRYPNGVTRTLTKPEVALVKERISSFPSF